jgi:hypothetical protein
MITRAESVQSWLENITYQMCNMVGLFTRQFVEINTKCSPEVIQTAGQ